MKTNTNLDEAIKKAGSMNKLAKVLGVTTAYISQVRAGKKTLSPERAVEIAEYIGADPRVAAFENLAAHASDEQSRSMWQRMAGSAFTIAILATLGLGSYPSKANAFGASEGSYSLYIMRSRGKLLLALIVAVLTFCTGLAFTNGL